MSKLTREKKNGCFSSTDDLVIINIWGNEKLELPTLPQRRLSYKYFLIVKHKVSLKLKWAYFLN